jgi:cobalamin biosynthesis protein CbiG
MITVGVGASRGCPVGELEDLVIGALADAAVAAEQVEVLATADVKRDEPAIVALAARRAWRFVTFPVEALAAMPVPSPSATVDAHVGTPSVAEAAALLAAGPGSELIILKRRSPHATCAVARTEDAWRGA